MEAVIKEPIDTKPQHFFGFVQGDTTGLLVSVQATETVRSLLEKLIQSSELRTGNSGQYEVQCKGKVLPLDARIHDMELKDFERIDLIKQQDLNV